MRRLWLALLLAGCTPIPAELPTAEAPLPPSDRVTLVPTARGQHRTWIWDRWLGGSDRLRMPDTDYRIDGFAPDLSAKAIGAEGETTVYVADERVAYRIVTRDREGNVIRNALVGSRRDSGERAMDLRVYAEADGLSVHAWGGDEAWVDQWSYGASSPTRHRVPPALIDLPCEGAAYAAAWQVLTHGVLTITREGGAITVQVGGGPAWTGGASLVHPRNKLGLIGCSAGGGIEPAYHAEVLENWIVLRGRMTCGVRVLSAWDFAGHEVVRYISG